MAATTRMIRPMWFGTGRPIVVRSDAIEQVLPRQRGHLCRSEILPSLVKTQL